jgi:hypothetical protein
MTDLVVVLWRPDTTTGIGPPCEPTNRHVTWIGGRWASDQRVYRRDELPRSFAGQESWPAIAWFERIADAEAYLIASRDHTACQIAVDEFRRCFSDVELRE